MLQFSRNHATEVAKLDDVGDVLLTADVSARLRSERGGRTVSALVTATSANAVDFEHLDIQDGRFFTDQEANSGAVVIVLSRGLARALSETHPPELMLGRSLRTESGRVEVVGIYDSDTTERTAYLPMRAGAKVFPDAKSLQFPQIRVRANTLESVEQVKLEIEDWVATHFGPPEQHVTIQANQSTLKEAEQGIALFKLVMGAITSVSLLVGGIGIMNVLLASVVERTREIGIRRATGASRHDILVQFLTESVTIASIGAVVGIILGAAGALFVGRLAKNLLGQIMHAAPSVSTLFIAVSVPAMVGLVFGIFPARRAANLSPMDAIRHE
jgi:putative ABC transport system permease protein